jgi:hypothetical protein
MTIQNPIVFDPAREVNLFFRINRDGVAQTLTFIDQTTGLPYDVSTKTWQLNIKESYSSITNSLQLLSGTGLTIGTNSITIEPTAAQTAPFKERAYYYELYNVTDKQTWLCGNASFHAGKFDNYYSGAITTVGIGVSSASANWIVVSSSLTASLWAKYVVVSSATFTDPTPVEGGLYEVVVRNGTATVGGVAYNQPGTLIRRIFHSGSWTNFVNTVDSRISQTASTATLTPDLNAFDTFEITAQAAGLTIANPTGTVRNFDGFIIRVTDNGTARALSFGSNYRAFGAALPTTTTIGKTLYITCIFNSTVNLFDVTTVQQV